MGRWGAEIICSLDFTIFCVRYDTCDTLKNGQVHR
eukprot:COSAG02_NODE_23602_length_713_cov_1.530945_1_plen_34_part_01